MDVLIVFPHQLFVKPKENTMTIFVEDQHFFDEDFKFHKQKLVLHRASMKAYYESFEGSKEYFSYPIDRKALLHFCAQYNRMFAYYPNDYSLMKKYQDFPIEYLEDPNFLTDLETIKSFFENRQKYYMHDFYVFQRNRLNLLMDYKKPLGGRYSFDTENRHALPDSVSVPKQPSYHNGFVKDAIHWVEENFKNHPGTLQSFHYPIRRKEALKQLNAFVAEKLENYGPYQDALSEKDPFLFHSNLSSSLNIGLISPLEVVNKVKRSKAPIASKEGFIRQIIGWREFVRAVYILEGQSMIECNTLNFKNTLNNKWFESKTMIPILDKTLKKIEDFAYSHHIERLMVLGNFMFLMNIHPKEVYRYFMTMHIDAYEWVMIPNIFGMSQYACGPLMTTKPYFSAANYLLKMGVPKDEWVYAWDALFYCFLDEHKALIEKNPRLSVLLRNLARKPEQTMKDYKKTKRDLVDKLTN